MVRNAIAQKGISPKLLADALVSVAAFLALWLLGLDLEQDPVLAAGSAKAAGLIAGVIVKPGRVVVEKIGPASDEVFAAGGGNVDEPIA